MPAVAQGEAQAGAAVGGHLQPPQRGRVGLLRPAQHRGAGAAAQALLECPQRIARTGLDDLQPGQVHARVLPGRCIGDIRRGDQGDDATGAGHPRQRRQQQRQLTHAVGRQQQFGQRAPRPAALRQQRVQRGMAGGLAIGGDRRTAPGVPQRARGEHRLQGDRLSHLNPSAPGRSTRPRSRSPARARPRSAHAPDCAAAAGSSAARTAGA